jgi:protein TonB
MEIDEPDGGHHEARRYAVVAAAIASILFVSVPIVRGPQIVAGTPSAGIVPVRLMTANGEQQNAATPIPAPAVTGHAEAHARSAQSAAVRSAAANISGSFGDAGAAEDQVRYEETLKDHIAKYMHYPRAALRECPSGTAYLRFQADRDGQLLSVVVEQSSGCAVIDNEAIETVRRAQPLPSVPAVLPARVTVHLPLSYGKS